MKYNSQTLVCYAPFFSNSPNQFLSQWGGSPSLRLYVVWLQDLWASKIKWITVTNQVVFSTFPHLEWCRMRVAHRQDNRDSRELCLMCSSGDRSGRWMQVRTEAVQARAQTGCRCWEGLMHSRLTISRSRSTSSLPNIKWKSLTTSQSPLH